MKTASSPRNFSPIFDINLDSAREKPPGRFEIMTPRDIGLLFSAGEIRRNNKRRAGFDGELLCFGRGQKNWIQNWKARTRRAGIFSGEVYTVTKQDGKKYACKFLGINKENGLPAVVPYKKEPGKNAPGKSCFFEFKKPNGKTPKRKMNKWLK